MSKVVTDHDDLLTQSRYISMSKLRENIFLIRTRYVLQTTYGSQQFAKISVFNVDYFVLPLLLRPRLRSVAKIDWKKTPIFFFLLLVQK